VVRVVLRGFLEGRTAAAVGGLAGFGCGLLGGPGAAFGGGVIGGGLGDAAADAILGNDGDGIFSR
jgi:hypothetical protein